MGKTKAKIMFWVALILIIGFISPTRIVRAEEENESSEQVITENEDETKPTDSDDTFIEDSVEQTEEDNNTNEQDEVLDLYEFDNNAMAPANTSEPISIEFICSDDYPNEMWGNVIGSGIMSYNISGMVFHGTLVMHFSNGDTLHFTLSYIPDGIIANNYPFKCTENNANLTVNCTSNKNEWFIGYDAAVVNVSCVYNNKELSCEVPITVIPHPNSISYEEAMSNAVPIEDGSTLNEDNMVLFYTKNNAGKEIQLKGVMTYVDVPYSSIATLSYSWPLPPSEALSVYMHKGSETENIWQPIYLQPGYDDPLDPSIRSSVDFFNDEVTPSIRYYILVEKRNFDISFTYPEIKYTITQNLNIENVEDQDIENKAVQIQLDLLDDYLMLNQCQRTTFNTVNDNDDFCDFSGILTYIDVPYLTTVTIELPYNYHKSNYPIKIHKGNEAFYRTETWEDIKVDAWDPHDLSLTNVTSKDSIRYYLLFDYAYYMTSDDVRAYVARNYINEYGLYSYEDVYNTNYYCGFNLDGSDLAKGWKKLGSDWYYFEINYGRAKIGWFYDTDYTYYFGTDGVMVTGQQTINNVQYNFSNSGVLKTGWIKDGSYWYYLNKYGSKQTGWLKDSNGTWYYLDNDGKMVIGFKTINYVTYFFNENGAMHIGWKSFGSGDDMWWYYFNKDGSRAEGWKSINGNWYYFNVLGHMHTGWLEDKNTMYYFTSSGAMKKGWQKIDSNWYYFTSSGAMKKGWGKIDNDWYYFDEEGKMVTNTTIDGYKIGADGKMK